MNLEGIGSGGQTNTVRVDDKGRLRVRSISEDDVFQAVLDGRGFQAYTGEITLVSATRVMALLVENGNDQDLIITSAVISTGESNAADNNILIERVGNIADTDDIIVSGADAKTTNRNIGSPSVFVGSTKAGPQPMSGNEVAVNGIRGDFTRPLAIDFANQAPKGSKLGIAVTPPAGNTSMTLTISLTFHLLEETETGL